MRYNPTCSGAVTDRTRRARWTWVLAAFLVAIAAVAVPASIEAAQQAEISTDLPDLMMTPDLVIEDGALQLDLDQAVRIALQRNLGLIIDRYRVQETTLGVQRAFGVYDLGFATDVSGLDETAPTASNLSGAEVQVFEQQDWNWGFSQLAPTGGTASLRWANRRQSTNSLFATLNPSYRIDFDLNINQPLLRDLGRMATERNLRIARTNRDISNEDFERQVVSIILQVEQAYWNLAEAIAQLGVDEESLVLAIQLHEQNQIRVDVGTLAPLELVQSEAGIANRELEIIRSKALVGDRADVLRQLLNLDRDEFWDVEIDPTTDPFEKAISVDVKEAISTALVERPELRSKRLSISNFELDTEYYRNQKRPRLDLDATYGLNGLGGDITDRNFLTGEILGTEDGGYGDAIDQIKNGDFAGWRVALNFLYPIQNRTAKANSTIADLALDRSETEYQNLELDVVTEVRRVARLVGAAAEQIDSAEVSRRLEERNYEAEKKRYENGMSTSFQVLRIQEDLSTARSIYVAAVAGYRRALAMHYQSIGTLIEEAGIELIEPPSEAEE